MGCAFNALTGAGDDRSPAIYPCSINTSTNSATSITLTPTSPTTSQPPQIRHQDVPTQLKPQHHQRTQYADAATPTPNADCVDVIQHELWPLRPQRRRHARSSTLLIPEPAAVAVEHEGAHLHLPAGEPARCHHLRHVQAGVREVVRGDAADVHGNNNIAAGGYLGSVPWGQPRELLEQWVHTGHLTMLV